MNYTTRLPALCLMLLTLLTSCGKKAKDISNQVAEGIVNGVENSLIEESLKDIQSAIIENDLTKLTEILAHKKILDLNSILDDGETLMTLAAKHNRSRMIQLLHENNGSLYRSNSRRETALMVAAIYGHESLVKLLLSLGSKPDAKDQNGNTALLHAIKNKHQAVALYLINNGTNIDITNDENQNALKLAEIMDLSDVLELLRSLTQSLVGLPDRTTLKNLVNLGDVHNLNSLLTKYPTLVHEYKDLNLLVLILQTHGLNNHDKALSMTTLLLSYGIDVNGFTNADMTPLITAVKLNFENFVSIFLNENANPNMLDTDGKSALIWAILNNNPVNVKYLLNKSAPEKYTYYENGKKKTMKACTIARQVKKDASTTEEKKANEDILDLLGCGLRWLF